MLTCAAPLPPAGLPDMAMSALVKEQIKAVAPGAIAIIAADKFAVSRHTNDHNDRLDHSVSSHLIPSCRFSPAGGVQPDPDRHVHVRAGCGRDRPAAGRSVRCAEDGPGHGADAPGGPARRLQR